MRMSNFVISSVRGAVLVFIPTIDTWIVIPLLHADSLIRKVPSSRVVANFTNLPSAFFTMTLAPTRASPVCLSVKRPVTSFWANAEQAIKRKLRIQIILPMRISVRVDSQFLQNRSFYVVEAWTCPLYLVLFSSGQCRKYRLPESCSLRSPEDVFGALSAK